MRRAFRRAFDQFRTPVESRGVIDHAHLPSSGLEETLPGEIYGYLDTPQDGAIESSSVLVLTGWTCAPDGIAGIRCYVDGAMSGTIRQGLARTDVAESLPRVPGAGSSGFTAELPVGDLAHGAHLLELVVVDTAGHRRITKVAFRTVADDELYDAYVRQLEPSAVDAMELRRRAASAAVPVVIWLRVPPGADETAVSDSLNSVAHQSYRDVRCRIVVEPVDRATIERLLDVVDVGLRGNFEILDPDGLTAIEADSSAYSGILEPSEVLSEHAILQLVARAAAERPDVLYADHDSVDPDGRRARPWFNPDWSPDYLLARNYVGGFYLFRDALRHSVLGAMDRALSVAWRYDLLLRLTDGSTRVTHLPNVLWSTSAGEGGEPANTSELEAAQLALDRRFTGATAERTEIDGIRRIHWPINGEPLVSIIVPTTGKLEYVEPLLRSIKATSYANYELVVIDNSRGRNPEGIDLLREHGARLIERDEDFNWAKLNNDGARESRGELLLFLNDDIEIVDPDWLGELVSQALRPDIGAVGSMLLYPDGRIQHAGVFLVGYGGGAVHLFMGMDPAASLYLDLHRVQREVAAVTGACLMVRKASFDQAEGFNERLAITGNDVDLCLRLAATGQRTIWTPYCRLLHHESATRRDVHIGRDETTMWQLWGDFLRAGDPFHSPHFAKDRVDCAIDARRVVTAQSGGPRYPAGVNLIGYIRAEMGVGQAARGLAAALETSGLPFTIIDYQHGNPSRMSDDSWSHLVSRDPIFDVNVVYVNADLATDAYARIGRETFDERYTIGAWTWELPEFPDDWAPSFRLVNEVWVPSTFVQQAIALKSPVPVVRMPHAVRPPAGPFADRSAFGLPADAFLFLMMYDFHSVRRRKNPEGAIDAFCRAFGPDDTSVGLVIKMNNADHAERRLLEAMIDGRPNVQIVDRTLSRVEVDSLVAVTDCFVSLHRAEGFGLGIAEAMALGKPAVATYWSGNVDFMSPWNSAPVQYELKTLEEDYGPYRAGQLWAEPDLENAAWWMRELAANADLASSLGESARISVAAGLGAEAVGKLISARLEHVDRLGIRRS